MAEELQMQINDVLSCLGQCAGCVLVQDERKERAPAMPRATLLAAVERLEEHAAYLRGIKRINVIFGIGDHIIYGSDYLVELHQLGSRIIQAGEPKEKDRSVVFFSTSLVGRPKQVIDLMRNVRERITNDVPFIPQVVLDGRLMNAAKFGPQWAGMVEEAKELFGRVDLATNLSNDAVSSMTPRQLLDFSLGNGFDELTINWSPTMANAHQTLSDPYKILEWILELDDLIDDHPWVNTTYRPVIAKMLMKLGNDGVQSIPVGEVLEDVVLETISKSFEIEPSGHIIPKFEAVGDVTHSARHGLPAIGHINDGSIAETISKAHRGVQSKILAIHSRGPCNGCEHAPVCAGTGFHVATHVGRRMRTEPHKSDISCPHLAAGLIEAVSRKFETGRLAF